MKRYWIAGILASGALASLPSTARGIAEPRAGRTLYAASGDAIADLRTELADADRQLREAEDQYAKEKNAAGRNTRGAREAKDRFDNRARAIRQRKEQLRNQIERATDGKGAGRAYQEKLDNTNDQIAAERQRHGERMRNLPRGSAAAAAEQERFDARMGQVREKRDDLRESRQDTREMKQSGVQYKRDVRNLKEELAAEELRHKRALKYLPAYSEAAQEEQRLHEQKVREIEGKTGQAADRRDLKLVDKSVKRDYDADADSVKMQTAEENARHARRMNEVNAGSAAAVAEQRQHEATMASLTGRRGDIAAASEGDKSARGRAIVLRQQLAEQEARMAAETARHGRMLNQVEAGSAGDAAERERHARIVADIEGRRASLRSELASVE